VAVTTTLPDKAPEPEATLGWEVIWWSTHYIRQPDGEHAGDPWVFTPEQLHFLLHWYAIDPAARWVSIRGVLRRAKGWGKSPFVAVLALAELCGPVRFDAWAEGGERRPWRADAYEAGEPIGQNCAQAWVQIAGVSEKQTTNTMSMVLAMCDESPIVDDYGLDLGITRIYAANGSRLEPITASASTAEGARPTFIVEDETHWWTDTNGGTKLDRVCRRNVAKIPGGTGRVLETTNAHAAGEQSVAERSYEAYLAQRDGRIRGETGLLYDAREPSEPIDLADAEQLQLGLKAAYGDSTWVDLKRLRHEIWDPGTPPEDSRRFYLNQISTAVDAWLSQPEWAACTDIEKVLADHDVVTLGFDGSHKRVKGMTDATALVGCRVADGHLFELGVWEQPQGAAGADWAVPTTEVEAAVRHAFNRFDVVGMFADPSLWGGHITQWEAKYNSRLKVRLSRDEPMHWWMGGFSLRLVRAVEAFHEAVVAQELTHDGSYRLTQHVLNARRKPTRGGIAIDKEHPDSARKIDAAHAAVFAWAARLSAVAQGLGGRGRAPARRIR
jgi:hypothetical protein